MEVSPTTPPILPSQRSLFWQVRTIIITRLAVGSFVFTFGSILVNFFLPDVTQQLTRAALLLLVALLYLSASSFAIWIATNSVIKTSQIDATRSKQIVNWVTGINIFGFLLYLLISYNSINSYLTCLHGVDIIVVYYLLLYCFQHKEIIINRSRKSLAVEQFVTGVSIIVVVLVIAFGIVNMIQQVNVSINTSDEMLSGKSQFLRAELDLFYLRYKIYPKTLLEAQITLDESTDKDNQIQLKRFTYVASEDGQHYKLCATMSSGIHCWTQPNN
ncbi:MAG: hypothetical protein WC817_02960 [Patescibacteria group bacterium]|jgi:hypothetical protein